MRRVLAGFGLASWMILVSAGAVDAGDGPPPLTPPVLGPPVALEEPPVDLPPPLEASPLPPPGPVARPAENGPMLVIPGVNTPRPGQRRPTTTPPTSAPATLPPAILGPRSSPAPSARPDPSELPQILESEVDAATEAAPHVPAPSVRPAPARPAPNRRPQGLFDRLLNPSRPPRVVEPPVRVEPRTDPAADAALKRRAERQIEELLGDKLRDFDVRVVGKDVVVRARTLRFWQRRAIRSRLETLPALSGYRVVVHVDE